MANSDAAGKRPLRFGQIADQLPGILSKVLAMSRYRRHTRGVTMPVNTMQRVRGNSSAVRSISD
jgi:hypothetical protein